MLEDIGKIPLLVYDSFGKWGSCGEGVKPLTISGLHYYRRTCLLTWNPIGVPYSARPAADDTHLAAVILLTQPSPHTFFHDGHTYHLRFSSSVPSRTLLKWRFGACINRRYRVRRTTGSRPCGGSGPGAFYRRADCHARAHIKGR